MARGEVRLVRLTLEQVKRKAFEMYNGGPYDQRQIIICDDPKLLRHEDPQLGGSGTWIDCSIFVPDDVAE